MKKVLIISTPFFGYQESVGNAFKDLGFDVKIETYDEPIHPFKGTLKWRHKFAFNKEKLRSKSREKYNTYIRDKYDSYSPDIVFIYNGTILSTVTLDYFRLRSKVILWMYDSVFTPRYARSKEHIDHVDAFFCFEKRDVEYYRNIGKTAYFLPLACDTHIYYPLESKKDIDILFVGNIYGNQKRINLLKAVIREFPDLRIEIYGPYKPYYKNPLKWLFREKRDIFKNVNISPSKVNELYSRSKIALNIHHEQTTYGANQRVFEASGAGIYQICDSNPFIESLFPSGEIGLYRTEEELMSLIRQALTNDKSDQVVAAHNIIVSGHTFEKRVQEMLEKLSKSN